MSALLPPLSPVSAHLKKSKCHVLTCFGYGTTPSSKLNSEESTIPVSLSWGTAYIPRSEISQSLTLNLVGFVDSNIGNCNDLSKNLQSLSNLAIDMKISELKRCILTFFSNSFDSSLATAGLRLAYKGKELKTSDDEQLWTLNLPQNSNIMCIVDVRPVEISKSLLLKLLDTGLLEKMFSEKFRKEASVRISWESSLKDCRDMSNLKMLVETLERNIRAENIQSHWVEMFKAWSTRLRRCRSYQDVMATFLVVIMHLRPSQLSSELEGNPNVLVEWVDRAIKFINSDINGILSLLRFGAMSLWNFIPFSDSKTFMRVFLKNPGLPGKHQLMQIADHITHFLHTCIDIDLIDSSKEDGIDSVELSLTDDAPSVSKLASSMLRIMDFVSEKNVDNWKVWKESWILIMKKLQVVPEILLSSGDSLSSSFSGNKDKPLSSAFATSSKLLELQNSLRQFQAFSDAYYDFVDQDASSDINTGRVSSPLRIRSNGNESFDTTGSSVSISPSLSRENPSGITLYAQEMLAALDEMQFLLSRDGNSPVILTGPSGRDNRLIFRR